MRAASTPSTPDASTTMSRRSGTPATARRTASGSGSMRLTRSESPCSAAFSSAGVPWTTARPSSTRRISCGEPVGLFEVVRGQDDGERLLAGQPADLRPHRGARLGVEARRGLVEEQHLRAVDERGRDIQPPPHAAGEGADADVGMPRPGRTRRAADARASGHRRRPCPAAARRSRGSRPRSGAGRCSRPGTRSRWPRARRRPARATS